MDTAYSDIEWTNIVYAVSKFGRTVLKVPPQKAHLGFLRRNLQH